MKYKVEVAYTFLCEFEIEADNKEQAKEHAIKHCGAVGPNYQSTITDEWSGNVHPNQEKIKSVKKYE